ncbi:MAG: tetratricopeptide repeat protein [Magnetococcales bacterium]|nr:tetratricopeptide repeat protein [Magnetococcales bacterium]
MAAVIFHPIEVSLIMDKTKLTKLFQHALKIHGAGDPAGAERLYREIVQSLPEFVDVWYLWGIAAYEMGEYEDAAARFSRAIAVGGQQSDIFHYLGLSQLEMGRLHAAKDNLLKALSFDPDNPQYLASLGNLALASKELKEAESWYLKSLALKEDFAPVHYNLSTLYREQSDNTKATQHLQRTLELDPNHWKAHFSLGLMDQLDNRTNEAIDHYSQAIRIRPDYWRAVLAKHLVLPTFCATQEEMALARRRWMSGVEELQRTFHPQQAKDLEEARHACESLTNFYLHYQGLNDLAEQKAQGALLTRIANLVYPGHDQPLPLPRLAAEEKIHVAFVSSFLYGHSVYKTHSRLITLLDRSRFRVSVFYTGTVKDDSLKHVMANVDVFHDIGANSSRLKTAVGAANPHVLIYTDLGMDPVLNLVSALRLAPIQCNAGGHPITSGLANMDYFLSSDAMEADHAQDHYSETLVRLPNLAHCYPTPQSHLAVPPPGLQRQADDVVYCNLQNMIKLLPQHDDIYPAIAEAVPNSRFWFIESGGRIGEIFRARLDRVFRNRGLNYETYCRLFPKLPLLQFFGLIQASDIILDGIAWSGNNSSMEALSLDKPIVTCTGEMFRSRHTHGILECLGVTSTRADNLEQYIAIAIRLGLDLPFRNEVILAIRNSKHRIFEDQTPVRGLEQALEDIINSGN